MKTERRHELQTNVLADWIAKHYKTIEPYSKSILAVAIALLVGYSAWSFISWRPAKQRDAAEWDNFDGGKEELTAMVARHSIGTPIGNMARLSLADINLFEGIDKLLTDRAEALKLLKMARDDYGAVADVPGDPMVSQLARCGKAKAEESLGELDAARADYKLIAGYGKLAFYNEYAKQRLTELQRPSVQEFYTVLAETQPKKPETPGTPGLHPSTDLQIPGEKLLPDSLLDKSPLFGTPPDETKKGPAEKSTDDKAPWSTAPEKTEDKTPVTPKTSDVAPEKSPAAKTPDKTPAAKAPEKTPAPKTPDTPATKTPKK